MDEESREFLEGRIYPIDETTFLIDEKWLESFVRKIVDKMEGEGLYTNYNLAIKIELLTERIKDLELEFSYM